MDSDAVTLHEWGDSRQLDPRVVIGSAVVFTNPRPTPMRVHAVQWHAGEVVARTEPLTVYPGDTYRCPYPVMVHC